MILIVSFFWLKTFLLIKNFWESIWVNIEGYTINITVYCSRCFSCLSYFRKKVLVETPSDAHLNGPTSSASCGWWLLWNLVKISGETFFNRPTSSVFYSWWSLWNLVETSCDTSFRWFIHHLSWTCFVNTEGLPDIILSHRTSS